MSTSAPSERAPQTSADVELSGDIITWDQLRTRMYVKLEGHNGRKLPLRRWDKKEVTRHGKLYIAQIGFTNGPQDEMVVYRVGFFGGIKREADGVTPAEPLMVRRSEIGTITYLGRR
jgi:hypothetical protein